MTHLCRKHVEPFGPIWFPKGGDEQIQHLGSEVREYFHTDLELEPGDVVFDVGANVGAFAMQAARHTPSLHIVCVEPIPILFDALKKNLEEDEAARSAKKSLFQVGLTHEDDVGEVEFTFFQRLPCDSTRHMEEKRRQFDRFFASKGAAIHRSMERRLGWFGGVAGRIAEWCVAGLPKGRIGRWMSDWMTGATRVRCKLVTLDTVLEEARVDEVALLKVDVEGAELDVLRGISTKSWRRVRQIVLEGHDEDGRLETIKQLLQAHDFDVFVDTPEIAKERGLNNFLLFARSRAMPRGDRTRPHATA